MTRPGTLEEHCRFSNAVVVPFSYDDYVATANSDLPTADKSNTIKPISLFFKVCVGHTNTNDHPRLILTTAILPVQPMLPI